MPSAQTPVQALSACLAGAGVGAAEPVLLACSGGRDSQVLMHAAAQLAQHHTFVVAHVHHGLQTQADHWQLFCAAQAASLGLPFHTRRLQPPFGAQASPSGVEAWAREWRYRALADMARAAGASRVLTAHHAHDQLETVELRRRRGSGVLGLSGMRACAPLPHAPAGLWLLRPFLGLGREQLADWGRAQGIEWVDDPSNTDPRFTRNRVRRVVDQRVRGDPLALPAELAAIGLVQQAADRIRAQAAADVQAASLHMLRDPADAPGIAWLAPSAVGQQGAEVAQPGPESVQPSAVQALSRAALLRLDPARRAEALRHWLGLLGCRMPSRAKLAELERQLVLAGAAEARVCHDGRWLLRYRDRIGLMPRVTPIQPTLLGWRGEKHLALPAGMLWFEPVDDVDNLSSRFFDSRKCGGADGVVARGSTATLTPSPGTPPADDAHVTADGRVAGAEEGIVLDSGRGGERLRLSPEAPSRSLKNLMQERGVPSCLRACLPVLRRQGRLIFAAPFDSVVPVAWLNPAEPDAGQSSASGAFVRLRWQARPDIAAWL